MYELLFPRVSAATIGIVAATSGMNPVFMYLRAIKLWRSLQAVLMVISWFKLSCGNLEWVPTARSKDDAQHTIRMDAASDKESSKAKLLAKP